MPWIKIEVITKYLHLILKAIQNANIANFV